MKSDYVKILIPSYTELVFYMVLSVAILLGSVVFGVSNQYQTETDGQVSLQQTVGARVDELVSRTGKDELIATLVLASFWAGAGALTYLLITVLGNLFQSEIDDLSEAKEFVRPGIVSPEKKWLSLIERSLIRASSMLAIIGFLVATALITGPILMQMFDAFAANLLDIGSIVNGLIATIFTMLHLHLFVVLLRIALLRSRLFGGVE